MPSPSSTGYLGQESLYPNPSPCGLVDDTAGETTEFRETILKATGATEVPAQMLVSALADNYFHHMYPLEPIIDPGDLAVHQPSPLLVSSVCLMGTTYGHPRGLVSQLSAANKYYLRVKTLLVTDYEKNDLLVLKALCILTCRSVKLPTQISMDSSWHWLGVALRYAIHMGLHKEATYEDKEAGGSFRRMWWHLFVRLS